MRRHIFGVKEFFLLKGAICRRPRRYSAAAQHAVFGAVDRLGTISVTDFEAKEGVKIRMKFLLQINNNYFPE
jgi:hypothetical protein